MASSLQVSVDDEDIPIQALQRLDMARPDWQNTSADSGETGVECVGQAGPNLLALYKVPSMAYRFTVDVVRNAILPLEDTDHIQISEEYMGALLDYAQHLALFKDGEINIPLYKNFFMAAMECNGALRAKARNFPILYEKAQVERKERELEPMVANG